MSRQISRRHDFKPNVDRDGSSARIEAAEPKARSIGFWVVALGLVLGCAATVAAITASTDEDKYFVNSI